MTEPSHRGSRQGSHAGELGDLFDSDGAESREAARVRDYRGTIAGLFRIEVRFLSASDNHATTRQGLRASRNCREESVREMIPHRDANAKVVLIGRVGIWLCQCRGREVPQALTTCTAGRSRRTSRAFRLKRERRMRVATKYLNRTRRYLRLHGVEE